MCSDLDLATVKIEGEVVCSPARPQPDRELSQAVSPHTTQRPSAFPTDHGPKRLQSISCVLLAHIPVMSSVLARYETFLLNNVSAISSLESSLRSVTWVLPGRFKDAELASEACAYCNLSPWDITSYLFQWLRC